MSLSVRVRAPRRGYKDLGSRYLYAAVVLFTCSATVIIPDFGVRALSKVLTLPLVASQLRS